MMILWAAVGGCGEFPRDADDTLARIQEQGVVRVGFDAAPPWVEAGDPVPGGIEPDLVRAFADALGARVEWVEAPAQALVEALEEREIDLAVGGFTADQPWGGRIGATRPYVKVGLALGVAGDRPEPERWRDVPVTVHPDRLGDAAAVRRVHAEPVLGDPAAASVAAAYEPELVALGFRIARRLHLEEHVMLLVPGENALALELDRFLHSRRASVEAALGGVAP